MFQTLVDQQVIYHNTHNTTYDEGCGCRCGVFLVKNVKKVDILRPGSKDEKIVDELFFTNV